MRQVLSALRDHLGGSKRAPPAGSAPIWNAFMRLSARRTMNSVGPNPVSFQEIEAYTRLMALPLSPRHVETLVEMDQIWLDHTYSKTRSAPEGVKTLPPVSKAPLSAALLDAMFG